MYTINGSNSKLRIPKHISLKMSERSHLPSAKADRSVLHNKDEDVIASLKVEKPTPVQNIQQQVSSLFFFRRFFFRRFFENGIYIRLSIRQKTIASL